MYIAIVAAKLRDIGYHGQTSVRSFYQDHKGKIYETAPHAIDLNRSEPTE